MLCTAEFFSASAGCGGVFRSAVSLGMTKDT
jgi:hypothetical protein